MCLTGPQRYITKDTPDLEATFTCLARVGASGYNMFGDALVAAMSPQLGQFGACSTIFSLYSAKYRLSLSLPRHGIFY